MKIRLALIGDYDNSVTAHRSIPRALALAAHSLNVDVSEEWIHTEEIPSVELSSFSGIWCVPASPYHSDENVILAIKYAREHKVPFLGTCGGYQYTALEFARNVLGQKDAENQEVYPHTRFPLIAALSCKLVETSDRIIIDKNSFLYEIYIKTEIEEEYHCSFGINRKYLELFKGSSLKFSANDELGDPRALELIGHPFFIGTAFQPERTGLKGLTHPVIQWFVSAAKDASLRLDNTINPSSSTR